jgi:hypothetical protein
MTSFISYVHLTVASIIHLKKNTFLCFEYFFLKRIKLKLESSNFVSFGLILFLKQCLQNLINSKLKIKIPLNTIAENFLSYFSPSNQFRNTSAAFILSEFVCLRFVLGVVCSLLHVSS